MKKSLNIIDSLVNQVKLWLKYIANDRSKIVWIITQTKGYGGTELHTIQLVNLLAKAGYMIHLVCCNHCLYDHKFDLDSLKIFYVNANVNDIDAENIQQFNVLFSNYKSQCIELIFPKGNNNMGSIPFFKICKKYFKKIYFIEHLEAKKMPEKNSKKYLGGLVSGIGFWWFKEKYEKRKASFYADKIIAVSDAVAKALVEECWYPSRKIKIIKNGTYPETFQRDENVGNEFKRKLEIPNRYTFIFGMVTRLDPIKGIDIAIEAFKLLHDRTDAKNALLLICGSGQEEENLKKLAIDLKVISQVIFSGFIEKPYEAFCAIDSIIFSSRKEGLPLALLEAMAAGCVPIVTNISGMPEVVSNPSLGHVITKDAEALYEAMLQVMNTEKHELNEMRSRVANHIKENFNAEKSFPKILEVIENR